MNPTAATAYPDVNEFIDSFTMEVVSALPGNALGVYLTGSLSYEAFNYNSSDIDITVIVRQPVSQRELSSIAHLHREIERKFTKWSRRFECSYTPTVMLTSKEPPRDPQPWYWGGDCTLYPEAPYGNEWIINNYFLYNHSISLFGPRFDEVSDRIDVEEVRKACVRDLFEEWAPKRSAPEWFVDSYHESYFVLNLCRILHAVIGGSPGSKMVAAEWAKENGEERWRSLIDAAQEWECGVELNLRQDALGFLDFVISRVSETEVYALVKGD